MIIPFSNKQNSDVFLSSQLEALKAQVMEAILVAKPLNEILNHLCLGTEKLIKDGVASIKILDERGEYLTLLAAPSLSQMVIDALNGAMLDKENGSCANAVLNKEPTFVCDVVTDERWNKARHISEKFGIGASWSLPISKNGEVIGTFAISSFEKREPTELQQQLMETAAYLVGLAMEKVEIGSNRDYSETAFNHSAMGVVVATSNGMILRSNVIFSHMVGIATDALVDTDMFSLLFDVTQHAVTKETLAINKFWRGEVQVRNANAATFPALVYINTVLSKRGDIEQYVVQVSDISLLKAVQEQAQPIAHHDLLTNLPNRISFKDYLVESLKTKSNKAVLLIDLDNFKAINDAQGHSIGDILLKKVAIRLLECMRNEDLVARLGGDEFIALLTYQDSKDLKVLASRINQKLAQPYQINGRKYFNSASIGITLAPDDAEDAGVLMKFAYDAMHTAKDSGKNQYCFYTKKMTRVLKTKQLMEVSLQSAIKNNEMYIVYLPKFDAVKKHVGVEALLRWQSNEHGFVLPTEFVPVAESTAYITELGNWALKRACHQVKKWHQQGKNICLSINVSGSQLTEDFEYELMSILSAEKFDPKMLELEISESAILKLIEQGSELLNRISNIGVKISIDDFGTGYSSIGDLKDLPLKTIKIDQSLISNLPGTKNDQAITSAVIAMGHALELKVVAEGVESEEQFTFLKSAGCDCFQGYLFGKPQAYDGLMSSLKTEETE